MYTGSKNTTGSFQNHLWFYCTHPYFVKSKHFGFFPWKILSAKWPLLKDLQILKVSSKSDQITECNWLFVVAETPICCAISSKLPVNFIVSVPRDFMKISHAFPSDNEGLLHFDMTPQQISKICQNYLNETSRYSWKSKDIEFVRVSHAPNPNFQIRSDFDWIIYGFGFY